MSDKIILSCVIMAAVFIVAVLFICRAMHYRKRMKNVIGANVPTEEITIGTEPPSSTAEESYLARYICLLRLPFHSSKTVKIRPEYYERIREITRVIGHKDVSITAYIDKVLKTHFNDYDKAISSFFNLYKDTHADRRNSSE